MLQKAFPVFCILLLLAGCSSLPSANSPATGDATAETTTAEGISPADESRLVIESIALAQRVASASPDEQRQEVAAAARSFTRQRNAASRLRYGLLLALPALAGADAQRALATLEPLSTTGVIGPLRQFATLIVLQTGDRLKEQRRAQQFRDQLDESRASERALIERTVQLKNQLDELRAIERTLIERGRSGK